MQLPETKTHRVRENGLYLDIGSNHHDPLEEVLDGMRHNPRYLPSKLFYDQTGSALFDEITSLDEYYLSRAEHDVLRDNVAELASVLPGNLVLIEYGSGSSVKTEILLKVLRSVQTYVPIDISREHLIDASEEISSRFPELIVLPVYADYSAHIDLGLHDIDSNQLAVFFPGSTIGNFEKEDAIRFMARIRGMVGGGGYLMIGVDLKKDLDILLPAYNDARGVTEAFNRNILVHINHRFSANFDAASFSHRAIYDESEGRIEMYLESTKDQVVAINGQSFEIEQGERIRTEYSHKYSIPEFKDLADRAGFDVSRVWTDAEELFSFQLLIAR